MAIESHHFDFMAEAIREAELSISQGGLPIGAVLTRDGMGIDEDLVIERLSEEHATVKSAAGTPLEPGDRVRILPNHACVVANLMDELLMVKGMDVVDRLPVAARGRIW